MSADRADQLVEDLGKLRDRRKVTWSEPGTFRSLTGLLALLERAGYAPISMAERVAALHAMLLDAVTALSEGHRLVAMTLCRLDEAAEACTDVPALYDQVARRWQESGRRRITAATVRRHLAPRVYRDLALTLLDSSRVRDHLGTRAPTARSAGFRVLWVDDNPANNAYEVSQLREQGVIVIQALSTHEAMLRLTSAHEHFDFVVTDMGRKEHGKYSPGAGLSLILRVREEGLDLPIVVYSAPITLDGAQRAIAAGATAATNDPADLLALLRAAQSADS